MSDDKDKAAREFAAAYAQGMYHDQPENIILAKHDYEKGFLAGDSHGRSSLARELLEWVEMESDAQDTWELRQKLRKKLEGE